MTQNVIFYSVLVGIGILVALFFMHRSWRKRKQVVTKEIPNDDRPWLGIGGSDIGVVPNRN